MKRASLGLGVAEGTELLLSPRVKEFSKRLFRITFFAGLRPTGSCRSGARFGMPESGAPDPLVEILDAGQGVASAGFLFPKVLGKDMRE